MPKTTFNRKKRLGRGYGSGKGGHTVGRGTKGQKSRGKVGLMFEGTKNKKSLIKRLPLLRGKGKFKVSTEKSIVINLKYLNVFPSNEVVDFESLCKYGIIDKKDAVGRKIKILGEGDINIALTVNLPVSKGAKEKIEKAGGKVGDVSTKKSLTSKIEEEKKVTKKKN